MTEYFNLNITTEKNIVWKDFLESMREFNLKTKMK